MHISDERPLRCTNFDDPGGHLHKIQKYARMHTESTKLYNETYPRQCGYKHVSWKIRRCVKDA